MRPVYPCGDVALHGYSGAASFVLRSARRVRIGFAVTRPGATCEAAVHDEEEGGDDVEETPWYGAPGACVGTFCRASSDVGIRVLAEGATTSSLPAVATGGVLLVLCEADKRESSD